MDGPFEPVVGIFDDTELFTKYRVKLKFENLVMGGTPQHPDIIEGWLRTRVMGGDAELKTMLRRTLDDLDVDVPTDATDEEVIEAAKKVAAVKNANTFRRDHRGLCLASYNCKAALKESTAILYPYQDGNKWGATKKAPRSFLAERIFVDDYLIPLGRQEADYVHTQVGHINGPRGPRATLTYIDACRQPEITFTVSSLEDKITPDQWKKILLCAEKQGMGSVRSMEHGKFKVTGFEKV